jgi:large subunit ribosomal protein L9
MELILKEEVEHLGSKNDVVKVKDGYGRNYLIPQGKAVLATPSAKKVLAENLKQQAHKIAKVLDEAKALAAQLADKKFQITAKVGENGKIFGSVTNIQAADALKNAGFIIERKSISFEEDSLKSLGEYKAKIKLHKEVVTSVIFEIVGE